MRRKTLFLYHSSCKNAPQFLPFISCSLFASCMRCFGIFTIDSKAILHFRDVDITCIPTLISVAVPGSDSSPCIGRGTRTCSTLRRFVVVPDDRRTTERGMFDFRLGLQAMVSNVHHVGGVAVCRRDAQSNFSQICTYNRTYCTVYGMATIYVMCSLFCQYIT